MSGPLVLYIEDNADNQRLVRRVLESRGYEVQVAGDGPSGLALARESSPALIIVDINIPGLDGYETTSRLRAQPHLRPVPIIALTAYHGPHTRERSLAAGCDGYLLKPIDARALPDQIGEYIAGRRESLPADNEVAALRDYTQRLVARLEDQVRELAAANAQLQDLDQLKSKFLSSLSHELRTPLTSLIGYLDLLMFDTFGSLTPTQREAVEVMQRNANLLARQLNNLFYLQELHSYQLHPAPIDLAALGRQVLEELRGAAEHGKLTLEADLAPVAPLSGDAHALEQALRNVLGNAIKFTPPGGRVRLRIAVEPARTLIRVEDTGIGIPDEELEKIFLPFYRGTLAQRGSYAGAGIGLTIARTVIDAHGGRLIVRSIPGQGSVFTAVLPRHHG